MKFPTYCAVLFLTGLSPLLAADDKAPGAEIFEDSELDVPGKATAPKAPAEKPAAALPAGAVTLLEKLAEFAAPREAALAAKITESRKSVADRLATMAAKVEGPSLEKILAATERCRTLAPEERLAHPVSAAALPVAATWELSGGRSPRTLEHGGALLLNGAQRGNWFWVDEVRGIAVYDWWGGDDCDLMRLAPNGVAETLSNRGVNGKLLRVENTELKPAVEAGGMLAVAALQEARWKAELKAELAAKRAQVHDLLMDQARVTKGEAGLALLKEAAALEAKPSGSGSREKPDRVAGVWALEKGRRFQFLPDGTVTVNETAKAGSWKWAKVKNWNTLLVTLNGARELFFARLSKSEPGKMRVYAYGAPETVLTKQ